MKKFLSVLLALAVAFTFTFGSTMSAFASDQNPYHYGETNDAYATQNDAVKAYLADVDTAYALAAQTLKSNYDIAKIKVTNNGKTNANGADVNHKIAASYWLAQLDAVYADEVKSLEAAKKTAQNVPNVAELTASPSFTVKTDEQLKYAAYAGDYAVAAMKAALADYKAEKVALANAVDTSVYSTTAYTETTAPATYQWSYPVGTSTVDCYVAKDVAAGYVAYTVAAINKIAVDATATYTVPSIDVLYDDVDDALDVYIQVTENADKTTTSTLKVANILTKVEEITADANKAANIAKAKADLESKVAVATAQAESLSAAKRALWDTVKAAYVEVETAKIDGTKATVTDFPAVEYDEKVTEVTGSTAAKSYLNAVDLVKKYNALAAELKAKSAAEVDAAKVDELLADTLEDVYAFTTTTYNEHAFDAALLNAATTYDKESAKAAMAAKFNADEMTQSEKVYTTTASKEEYYAKEWAAVEAALAAYNSAVDAAVTTTDIEKAKTELDKALAADKISNKAAINTLYDEPAMDTAVSKLSGIATAYLGVLNANKTGDDLISYATDKTALKVWCAEQGARTAEEVAALESALKADMAATKSVNQLKEDAKAVQALIDALPGKLTVASTDKDAIIAAKDAYDAYIKAGGSNNYLTNEDRIEDDLKALAAIDAKAITDAIAAIEKGVASNVVLADKEAVKNVVTLEEAYNDLYVTKYKVVAKFNDNGFAKTAMTRIRNLEATALKDAINALPTNVTEADKAAVDAAKEAYDAFVSEYTYYDNNNVFETAYDAAKQLESANGYGVNVAKLEAAVATIAELTKYDDIHAKADLLDMSRKLTIWRTSKTSIRVTAVGSVKNIKDNGYTVKYSFYKKNPGATSYKLIKTTTSNKYTYTNLKKGTNKFQVKVKVYDADGKLVATKMTYYRAAKIK